MEITIRYIDIITAPKPQAWEEFCKIREINPCCAIAKQNKIAKIPAEEARHYGIPA